MKLYAQTSLLCHSNGVTPVGLEVPAGFELPTPEFVAELKAASDATEKLLGKAVRDDERATLQAKLDELAGRIKHAESCLLFLATGEGKAAIQKWQARGRLAPAKPAPKAASDASKLLDEERAARKLAAQKRVEKYQDRVAKAEKSGDKARLALYSEDLDDAKAELAAMGG